MIKCDLFVCQELHNNALLYPQLDNKLRWNIVVLSFHFIIVVVFRYFNWVVWLFFLLFGVITICVSLFLFEFWSFSLHRQFQNTGFMLVYLCYGWFLRGSISFLLLSMISFRQFLLGLRPSSLHLHCSIGWVVVLDWFGVLFNIKGFVKMSKVWSWWTRGVKPASPGRHWLRWGCRSYLCKYSWF